MFETKYNNCSIVGAETVGVASQALSPVLCYGSETMDIFGCQTATRYGRVGDGFNNACPSMGMLVACECGQRNFESTAQQSESDRGFEKS